MVYMISYDLRQPDRNYEKLKQMLRDCSCGKCVHPLESVFIISSGLSSDKLSELIKSVVDTDDGFIVCEITQNYHGYIDVSHWNNIEQLFR